MKPSSLRVTLAALALLVGTGSALAAPITFDIDASHTDVDFSIKHYFSKVRGGFDQVRGTIVYDPENVAASSVEVVIPDSTINTGNANRDKHLRTEDFFWVEKHPEITFKSTKVVPGADANSFKVEGNLTMRGVTKPVVLDASFLGMGPVAIGGRDMGTRAGFEATTRVNRKDYEIIWNRTLDQGGVMLGDEVDIHLSIEAVSKKPATDAAPANQQKAPVKKS